MQHNTLLFTILSAERFLLGFSGSLMAYISSSYFAQAIHSDNVSGFFLASSVITLVILLLMHHIVAWVGRSKLVLFLLMSVIVLLVLLITGTVSLVGAVILVVYLTATTLVGVVFGMITESFVSDQKAGTMYGVQLALLNIGFLCGPFLSTIILERYHFAGLFFVLLIVYSIMFVLALGGMSHIARLNHVSHDGISALIVRTWRLSWMRKVYLAVVSLQVFYSVMTVYVPLYLRADGFAWNEIGLMFTIMLLPFAILEYPAGIIADRYWGERELLIGGFLITIVSVLGIIFFEITTFAFWTGILFLSRVGAALIESMTEVYFYKHVDGENIGIIDLYRTASSVGYIIAMVGMGALLVVAGDHINIAFFVAIGALVIGLMSAWMMQDTAPLRNTK